ncbi:MAG TPA: energy transducer TonB [Chitinispirillaceae bacterium]|nr:energy transducer TonB [Chitinispirillaceae bacterium]
MNYIIFTIKFILAFTTLLTYVNHSDAQTSKNSDPKLLVHENVDIPPSFLKIGTNDTVVLQLNIDWKGVVESCDLISGNFPELDTLVRKSVLKSSFSPAIENGQSVSSTINLRMVFIADSLLKTFEYYEPIIQGKVINKENGTPVSNAMIRLSYEDTTLDRSVFSFSGYCNLIGKIPGQKFEDNTFTAYTDSLGFFRFRLLPSGRVIIEATSDGYHIVKDSTVISEGLQTNLSFSLHKATADSTTNEIIVYGKKYSDNSIINIERREYLTGMTHSLSNIIQSLTPIRRSSKSESAILVRSGTPYDNLYLISGIPFYAPFHFAGFAFGENDGVMLATLTDIKVNIDGIAGKYPSVSGALIEANPGILRPSNPKLIPRPELAIDFGNRGVDLLLSFNSRGSERKSLQLGFSGTNYHLLKWMRVHYGFTQDASLGIGFPSGFGNLTLTGQYNKKRFMYEIFSWFAWDSYTPYNDSFLQKSFFPWGMVSIGLRPHNNERWNLTCGGSHQYFADGKRFGSASNHYISYLNNATAAIKFNFLDKKILKNDVEGRFEYKEWHGDVIEQIGQQINQMIYQDGKETVASIQSKNQLTLGAINIKNNLLLSSRFFNERAVISFDPGVSIDWTIKSLVISVNGGRVTSFPDFRGLPDENFRKKKLTTTVLSFPVKYQRSNRINFLIQPYLRLQDKLPKLNPVSYYWDSSATTAFSARGLESTMEYDPTKWITLYSNISLSDAHRVIDDVEYPYEWKSSLSSKCGVHLHFIKDFLHTYFSWNKRTGNYYYDFLTGQYLSLPSVSTHDLSIQIKYPDIKSRFYTRFNGYVTFHNLFNKTTIRDYYVNLRHWRVPIVSDGIFLTLGLKAGFRF